MLPTLLISESVEFSEQALARLREHCSVDAADLDRAGLLAAVKPAELLWVRLRHRIDAEVLDAAPKLRVILSATTGLNHIDVEAAEARGIRVISLRGETNFLDSIRATSELTLGLIFSLLRNIPAATQHVIEGGWNRNLFKGRELNAKTAGIVGCGRLGRQMGAYLQGLGMNVMASDPYVTKAEVPLLPLPQLLAQADLVTLHVNLNAQTTGFFGAREFAAMKPGAWLVNTSRGELLDESALLAALESGRLAGAALDVLSAEHSDGMPHHPLVRYAVTHQNLILTPHIGGCTFESMEKCEEFLAEGAIAWLSANHRSEVAV